MLADNWKAWQLTVGYGLLMRFTDKSKNIE